MRYLLDTNICIYIINRRPEAVMAKFRGIDVGEIGISSVTLSELWYGVRKSLKAEQNEIALNRFLAPLEILPYGEKEARHYGRIRSTLEKRGKPIGALDLMIGAHAVGNGWVLVTNNTKEFKRIQGICLENWT